VKTRPFGREAHIVAPSQARRKQNPSAICVFEGDLSWRVSSADPPKVVCKGVAVQLKPAPLARIPKFRRLS